MEKTQKTLLVTGASGYLASWVVKQLLDQGHVVHGTVRSLNNQAKVSHLLSLAEDYPEKLKLFEADLLQVGSFSEAMNNCDVVIHTASPYFLKPSKNTQSELIDPAIKGTENVLNSVNKTETVTRVVLTSSMVALYNNAKDFAGRPDCQVNESDVNHNQDMNYNSYAFSKTQAEKVAWDINAKQQRWDLVTVHPGAVFGPSLSDRKDATSVNMLIDYLNGNFKHGVPNISLGVVDVRDTAEVHVKAALTQAAAGKYLSVAATHTFLELAKFIDPEKFDIKDQLPRKEVPKFLVWMIAPFIDMQRKYVTNNVGYDLSFDSSRSESELGVNYRSTETTIEDHIQQLVMNKLI